MSNDSLKRQRRRAAASRTREAASKRAAAGGSQARREPSPQAVATSKQEKPSSQKKAASSRSEGRRRRGIGSTRVKDRTRLSEKMGASSRRRLFLQSTAIDFLLVLAVAVGLTFTVSFGFHSAAALRGNIGLIALMEAPLLLAMFVGSWSKKTLAPSIGATVVVAAVIVGVAMAVSPDPMFADASDGHGWSVNDVPGNYGIFAMTAVVCGAVSFLLSRRPVGLVFLLAITIAASGTVQYLWPTWMTEEPGVAASVILMICVATLLIYQCYKQSIYSANRVKRTSFLGAFSFSAIVVCICVAVGALVFFGVVAGLGLTTGQFPPPFEEYVSPPWAETSDQYSTTTAEGDATSDKTDDEEKESQSEAEGGSNSMAEAFAGFWEQSFVANMVKSSTGYTEDGENADYDTVMYLIVTWGAIITAVLIVLLVVAVILAQRARRTLRLRWLSRKSRSYEMWYLYTFLVGRFRRMRIRQPAHLTPLEFAQGFSKTMRPFTRDTDGVDFIEVSAVYQDVVFGGIQPTEEQMARVRRYYRAFFKNARRYVGWPKWLLYKYWRI